MTRSYRVGDILTLQRRQVAVDPVAEYQEIGIRSFGRGIFHKEPVIGAQLGSKRVFEIRPGDLIFNNVFAWEGAVALAAHTEEGKIGSHRFLTYLADASSADHLYLKYFFLSERGLELLGRASPGSAGRNRTLAVERFENLMISLPDIQEQRRVAGKLDQILTLAATLRAELDQARLLADATVNATLDAILIGGKDSGWPARRVGDVAEVNPKPKRLEANSVVTFVPMSAVDDVTGTIAVAEERLIVELKSHYKQFQRGDVLFARITPCMQNGKAAVVDGIPTDFGFGSTEFHVIRPADEVLPEWIHRIVRTRHFREKAAERFTGTAGQQRVPADFIKNAEIPVPETIEEQKEALVRIDSILERHLHRRQLHLAQVARAQALTPSVLNRAFNGDL